MGVRRIRLRTKHVGGGFPWDGFEHWRRKPWGLGQRHCELGKGEATERLTNTFGVKGTREVKPRDRALEAESADQRAITIYRAWKHYINGGACREHGCACSGAVTPYSPQWRCTNRIGQAALTQAPPCAATGARQSRRGPGPESAQRTGAATRTRGDPRGTESPGPWLRRWQRQRRWLRMRRRRRAVAAAAEGSV